MCHATLFEFDPIRKCQTNEGADPCRNISDKKNYGLKSISALSKHY